ncbi:DUF6484 domain-containing protein [Mesorhizobium sp. Mes31]|uniref:DUF6484 domain-containing protein n=1 Tax=Mesorhizobium sp. Mes31 TaxID=2926017 RepID=UPI00211928C2|nr:DUF6484 domain-containing protein [Mesorhizobium sp. Mes31]
MTTTAERIEGVVIGVFLGFGEDGPLVVFPGNPQEAALTARSLAELSSDMIGSEVALLFEGGDVTQPLIVGRIVDPTHTRHGAQIVSDGEGVRVRAHQRIELRCGKATIIMEKDGRITIRGTHIVSHASVDNNIRGASVNLN